MKKNNNLTNLFSVGLCKTHLIIWIIDLDFILKMIKFIIIIFYTLITNAEYFFVLYMNGNFI